ncbi:hypothetical protein K457DRAFT_142439 [Linnemannia elongata AG-77]|uniref:Uncharacterized protein n=1 Tax=Linnemannia elongata AG-77 TaxID=1314771 RepID=A0A197JF96_9FUNG|nr:hypothetical protein K457DRAFT_142439 [Linnemannia elongata AG-77]
MSDTSNDGNIGTDDHDDNISNDIGNDNNSNGSDNGNDNDKLQRHISTDRADGWPTGTRAPKHA